MNATQVWSCDCHTVLWSSREMTTETTNIITPEACNVWKSKGWGKRNGREEEGGAGGFRLVRNNQKNVNDLVCFLLLWQNTDQKHLERVYLAYRLQSTIIKGSQGRNSRQGPGNRNLKAGTETDPPEKCCFGLSPHHFLSLFSYTTQGHLPQGGTSHRWGAGLFHSNHQSRKCSTGQSDGGLF